MLDFKRLIKENKNNILFFAIMVLMIAALSVSTEKKLVKDDRLVPERNKNYYRLLREPRKSVDIMVLGDSLSYTAVTPMTLWKEHGFTSFVCGQTKQKLWETEELLRTALRTQQPKLVILETHNFFYKAVKSNSINHRIETLLNRYIPVFRGHDVWKALLMNKEYTEESFKGFVLRSGVKPYSNSVYMKKCDEKENLPERSLEYMNHIIKICRDCGADILLLGTPSPVNYSYKRHNTLKTYADEQGLTFVDLNLQLEDIGIDWNKDSLDGGDHLNLSGAEKVTSYLGKYLAENYQLPDHRGDTAFQAWAEESRIYEEKADKILAAIRGSG